ncbi:ABC transporter ATP-binding protein [Glaciibacter flavus]|uniref:ABC transporter ATP-binding protein n=1 Tax=Orlajensenia flava TaxID=2565934 RepID=A0A4S4FJB3_9MICO|nr:ABC transporter ATP-binding protein [Glaciibacter flavus]THG30420.1 ABC transporter ATP-binding protein [Glaciibacter flavus]
MGATHPKTPIEAAIDKSAPLASMLRLLAPSRGRLFLAVLAFVVKDSPIWALPSITAAIIDTVVDHGPLERIWLWAALALVLLALNYPFHMIFIRLSSEVTRTLAVELRNAITDRLQRLSIGFHNRQSSSIMQTKVVRDVENLELLLQQALPMVLTATSSLTGAIVMTAIQVPAFVIVFAVTVPVAVVLLRWIRSRARERNEVFRREVESLSAGVGEMAALMPITRGHGLEGVAANRVAVRAERVRDAGRELDTLNGRFGALSWISYQSLGILCLVGAAAASITGILPITPGEVVLLSTYFTVLTGCIIGLLNVAPVFTRGLESVRSIAEVLEDPDLEENEGKATVKAVSGHLQLQDASFTFADADRPAVDDITLDIASGETLALVGPSGSGKSTLLNMVLGFVRPTAGRVLLDGVDMATLDLRTARAFVSVVPQGSVLFEGTIRENVAYGLDDVTDGQVLGALREANALDILALHGDGLDAVVGDRGTRLSGGQRQRLAIARALVRDPRILILDEATSALDAVSEAKVKQALSALFRDRTTLIAAHRLSTIREADRIAYIDAGRVAELGTHDELMASGGLYAGLVAQQNG